MELAKEILAYFLSPLVLFFVAQVMALLCGILQRHQTATILSFGSIILLFIASIPVLTTGALEKMENQYPPLTESQIAGIGAPTIAVLGTDFQPRERFPATAEISPQFLARFVEGVRVFRSLPEARLIVFVSGKKGTPEEKEAFIWSMCRTLAVDRERIDLVTTARSTAGEARSVGTLISNAGSSSPSPVIIATSARHMPRAMASFEAAGLKPIAAPTDYEIPPADSNQAGYYHQWIPSTGGLWQTRNWLYETMASFWLRFSS